MKIKFIVLMFICVCCFRAHAQKLEFMGLELPFDFVEGCKKLQEHKFVEDDIVYDKRNWKNGHFWKHRNCYVDFDSECSAKVPVNQVYVVIPFTEFVDFNDYQNNCIDLIASLKEKYGIPQKIPTGQQILEDDPMKFFSWYYLFFHFYSSGEHNIEGFYWYIWNLPNGELRLVVNEKRIWGIPILYTSSNEINRCLERYRQSQIFHGKGSADL